MATYTTNYNLVKPGQDDYYNVADFNSNADIIDANLKIVADNIVDNLTSQGVTDKSLSANQGYVLANMISQATSGIGQTRGSVINALTSQQQVYLIDTLSIDNGGTGYVVGDSIAYTDNDALIDALFIVDAIDSSGAATQVTISKPGAFTADLVSPIDTYGGTGMGLSLAVTTSQGASTTLNEILTPHENDIAYVLHDELHDNKKTIWVYADFNGDGIFNWVYLLTYDIAERNFVINPITNSELAAGAITQDKIASGHELSFYAVAGGTSQALTATITDWTYADGRVLNLKLTNDLSAGATLAINAGTPVSIFNADNTQINAGYKAGAIITLIYNADNQRFYAQSFNNDNIKDMFPIFRFTVNVVIDLKAEIPFKVSGSYNCDIDWGDDTPIQHFDDTRYISDTVGLTHTYSSQGIYQITITGYFDTFGVGTSLAANDIFKITLTSIDAPITNKLNSLIYLFYECANLKYIPKDLFVNNKEAVDFSYAFSGCTKLPYIPIELFRGNNAIIKYICTFKDCFGLTGTTPTNADGLELWQLEGTSGYPSSIDGLNCFSGCLSLSNYSVIPMYWGGYSVITVNTLSYRRTGLAAATDGNGNVLFGGGYVSSGTCGYVEKIDMSGTKTLLTNLSTNRSVLAAATNGNGDVLFGGGYLGVGTSATSDAVDKYSPIGTKTTLTSLASSRDNLVAATDGEGNVLFGGGYHWRNSSDLGRSNVVDKYDSATDTMTSLPTLLNPVQQLAAAIDGNGNVLFGGGNGTSTASASITKYSPSGTRTSATALSVARYGLGAATDGSGNVLFAGGHDSAEASDTVDKYTPSGTRTTLTKLSTRTDISGAATDGNGNVLFVLLNNGTINKYDISGTRYVLPKLNPARAAVAATDGNGDVLMAGGSTNVLAGFADIAKYVKS